MNSFDDKPEDAYRELSVSGHKEVVPLVVGLMPLLPGCDHQRKYLAEVNEFSFNSIATAPSIGEYIDPRVDFFSQPWNGMLGLLSALMLLDTAGIILQINLSTVRSFNDLVMR